MTRKAPAFQLYVDDFLAGTLEMTHEEVGIYIRLLCIQWSRGVVNDRAIASLHAGDAVHYVLEEKFERAEDGWRNLRLETVRTLAEARAEAGSIGGSKSQANRQSNGQANHQANGQAKRNTPTPSPTPSPIPSSSPIPIPSAAAALAAAEGKIRGLDWEDVARRATKLGRACKVLPREFVWSAVVIAEVVNPGMMAEVVTKVLAGEVRKPKSYIESVLRSECEKAGFDWRDLVPSVPKPVVASEPMKT
jgi:uncharacterized protein YdaU (DUF1376 family)